MKIGFNVSPLYSGHKGRGIGFYTKNLLDQLKKQKDMEIFEFTDINDLGKVDMIHYPFFDLFNRSLPLKHKYPTVVTVHDVIPLKYSNRYPSGIKGKINLFYQKHALKFVTSVITDSFASKEDIIRYLKISADKINVIYLGVSDKFRPEKNIAKLKKTQQKYNLSDKFALFVGNVNWNKNILNMTQACIDAGVDLVIVGKSFTQRDNLNHPELRSFKIFLEKYNNNPKVHILGFIDDEDLVSIYNLAKVTLLVSFDEGFGIPILESQACGTPVIISNTSSLPEVAGDGASIINPNKIVDIKDAIERIFDNSVLQKSLVNKGFVNEKNFTWDKTVEQTIQVYKKILNTNINL